MGIHELIRAEKRRWKTIRETRDFEAIREGYNELKLSTPTDVKDPYIQQIVDKFVSYDIPKNTKILDAGSGSGIVCRHFKEAGFTDISAFDISDENVESTRPYANHVFRSTCENIDSEDNAYDIVICNGVIEHCMEIDKSLDEMYRVLKPGGYLYLMTDNAWWQTIITLKNNIVPKAKRYERFVQPLDGDFEVGEMKKIITDAKFKVTEFYGYGGIPVADGLIEKLTGKPTALLPVFKNFTSRMIFIAQK